MESSEDSEEEDSAAEEKASATSDGDENSDDDDESDDEDDTADDDDSESEDEDESDDDDESDDQDESEEGAENRGETYQEMVDRRQSGRKGVKLSRLISSKIIDGESERECYLHLVDISEGGFRINCWKRFGCIRHVFWDGFEIFGIWQDFRGIRTGLFGNRPFFIGPF